MAEIPQIENGYEVTDAFKGKWSTTNRNPNNVITYKCMLTYRQLYVTSRTDTHNTYLTSEYRFLQ